MLICISLLLNNSEIDIQNQICIQTVNHPSLNFKKMEPRKRCVVVFLRVRQRLMNSVSGCHPTSIFTNASNEQRPLVMWRPCLQHVSWAQPLTRCHHPAPVTQESSTVNIMAMSRLQRAEDHYCSTLQASVSPSSSEVLTLSLQYILIQEDQVIIGLVLKIARYSQVSIINVLSECWPTKSVYNLPSQDK